MVNSIVNEIITIPRWFNCPSWHCGDNLITLEGLLQNLTRELGAFERVFFFHWIDSSVLALMSTSMSLPICWLDACLRNFASRLKVVPVSTWTKLKVSLALVSITSSAVEKFKSSSSGFHVGTKYEIANFEIMRFCMFPAIVICLRTRLLQIAFWPMFAIECR